MKEIKIFISSNKKFILSNRINEGGDIDFIDKNTNELIWQGIGSGAMKMSNIEKKEERINEFVYEIISTYPPGLKK